MATELRLYYSTDYLTHISRCLTDLGVNGAQFAEQVLSDPWADLSLKERMLKMTVALADILPSDGTASLEILQHLLPQISGNDVQKYADMLCLFVPEYVVHQRDHLSLEQALSALTFFTCSGTTSELAIRPFIVSHTKQVMDYLLSLTCHSNANVRRWSSEGCRPRLPWAMALPAFKKDPALILPILEALRADDSKFVQKSVANNLNDIAKDNPDIVLTFAEKWQGSHPNTNWIIRHGLRTLLKQGHPRALALYGASDVTVKDISIALSQDPLPFGQAQGIEFSATITSDLPKLLRIEYAVDFMKANGQQNRKVFMISQNQPSSRHIQISKSHKFVDYTTRKHYGGEHRIALLLNGAEVAVVPFQLIKD
jgi:3-methyladenine DNA glycosylase AlkC